MRRNDQAHLGSRRRQGHGRAIVERALHVTLWMGAHVIWGTKKSLLDHWKLQQMGGATSGNDTEASREHIKQRRSIAIQPVSSHEHGGRGKTKLRGITRDDCGSSSQLPPIIPVARAAERAEQLMRMCLKHHCTRPHDLSPLPTVIARRADLIKPAMGNRQGVRLWQRALTSCLSGSVHVDHEPVCTRPVNQAARGRKRFASQ